MTHARQQALVDAIRVLRIELGIANDRVAAAAGLNPRDLDVLDVIDRDAPCTPGHLVNRTGIRAATLTGVLARLDADGWIRRDPNLRDARSARLTPTARFDELRALYSAGDSRVRAIVDDLPAESAAHVEAFLLRTADAVRDAASELPGR